MKKMILIAGLTLLSLGVKAQILVEGTNINDLDLQYIELVGKSKLLSPTKIKVFVDYGQSFSWNQQVIKSADGKTAAFNSMVDALNFMDSNGWEYVNNYIISDASGELTYKYLLRKKTK